MENWFAGVFFISEKDGIETTNYYKNNGFASRKELSSFQFVESIIWYKFIMGQNNQKSEEIREKMKNSITKAKKLELYSELGLTELLEKALTMSEEELSKAKEDFVLTNFIDLSQRTKQEEKILDDKLNNLNKK